MDGPFGVINRYVQIYCLLSLFTEVLLTAERADNKMPQYLLPQDFYNARFVSPSNPIRGEKIRNDQRFISRVRLKLCEIVYLYKLNFQRFRRGSVVALEDDKWPGGRIPYVRFFVSYKQKLGAHPSCPWKL